MKVLTVVGARPQIIKAAALSRTIKSNRQVEEVILHTGQHYDANMSEVFFEELQIPKPKYNLNVGSSNHSDQTAKMISGIHDVLVKENPDCLVVYGDTNSTLAAAIAASKIHCPVVHIEAGLRSFNKKMPEEINRILCDHVSTLLFSPTLTGIRNLENEGFNLKSEAPHNPDNPGVFHCGDVMFDNSIFFSDLADKKSNVIDTLGLKKENFILVTIHRDSNTDNPERLNSIFEALMEISEKTEDKLVLPLHPRTKNILNKNLNNSTLSKITSSNKIIITNPVSFLDMIQLERYCNMVITDSGGVQKEAFFFKKPCLILRPETEWVEIVKAGAAIITDYYKEKILDGFHRFKKTPPTEFPSVFGNGNAGDFILGKIKDSFQTV